MKNKGNARPQKGLVRRAQLGAGPAPFLKEKKRASLEAPFTDSARPKRAVEGQPAIP